MPPTLQFVDSISASATVRLDLRVSPYRLLTKPDFSPPSLRRTIASSALRDGALIPSSAYENRVLALRVYIESTTQDAFATALQNLHRELDRPRNILRWSTGQTAPVYFRTFRSPDYRLTVDDGALSRSWVDLAIIAEPFAYGERVDQAAQVVTNDPQAGTNPRRIEVTSVTGDVPTPLYMKLSGLNSGVFAELLISTRRHGTPGNVMFQAQSSALTLGPDTTLQTGDATMSGSNYTRTTFATVNDMTARLKNTTFPGFAASGSVDFRGTYRLLVLVRGTVASDVYEMRYSLNLVSGGSPLVAGDAVRYTCSNTALRSVLDLGLLTLPTGQDVSEQGYSGVAWPVRTLALFIEARRVSGSGSLDIDYYALMPADEEYLQISLQSATTSDLIIDGPNDAVYWNEVGTSGMESYFTAPRVGTIPLLTPNQTNRIIIHRADRIPADVNYGDNITRTTTATVSFWPRFLFVRP